MATTHKLEPPKDIRPGRRLYKCTCGKFESTNYHTWAHHRAQENRAAAATKK